MPADPSVPTEAPPDGLYDVVWLEYMTTDGAIGDKLSAAAKAAFAEGVAAGRTRAAAEIREQARSPLETNEIAVQALLDAARIAAALPEGQENT